MWRDIHRAFLLRVLKIIAPNTAIIYNTVAIVSIKWSEGDDVLIYGCPAVEIIEIPVELEETEE